MPSGRTHDRITLWGLPWVAILAYLLTRQGELTLLVAGSYLFSGLMFGPDLDIYSVQYRRWGVLRWIWRPYQSVIKHRSFLSHGFLIGTTLRVAYLMVIIALVGIVGSAIAQFIWDVNSNGHRVTLSLRQWLQNQGFQEVLALVIGLELGAMSHTLSDQLGSAYLKFQKKRQGKKRKISRKRK